MGTAFTDRSWTREKINTVQYLFYYYRTDVTENSIKVLLSSDNSRITQYYFHFYYCHRGELLSLLDNNSFSKAEIKQASTFY